MITVRVPVLVNVWLVVVDKVADEVLLPSKVKFPALVKLVDVVIAPPALAVGARVTVWFD